MTGLLGWKSWREIVTELRGGVLVAGNRANCVGVFERGHSRWVFVRIEAGEVKQMADTFVN